MVKVLNKPIILICTSGTAAANYFPAIVEANLCRIPLLVLTADRPPESRGWGAPQTIDQVGLYGRHVHASIDLPLPEPTSPMLAFVRHTASRAIAASSQGPVHLNVPFRDPLPPIEVPGDVPESLCVQTIALKVAEPRPAVSDAALASALEMLRAAPQGIIAVGNLVGDASLESALSGLALATGFPIFAETTSSLRTERLRPYLIAHGELLARNGPFAKAHVPQLAIRLGQAPVTRALARFFDSAKATLRIDLPGVWIDPSHRAALSLHGDLAETVAQLASRVAPMAQDASWSKQFICSEICAAQALTQALDLEPKLGELHAARELFDALPPRVPLWVASSMPIRDLESVAGASPHRSPLFASRGANGIDGTVASALGAAMAHGGRGALLIGDVALLHDLNSLLCAKLLDLSLTVVLVNNDGGGIFSFLEVAQAVDAASFEKLWGTPHGANFGPLVQGLGGSHRTVSSRAELRAALHASFESKGLQVIEVRTDHTENVAAHQRIFAAVDAAMESQPWGA